MADLVLHNIDEELLDHLNEVAETRGTTAQEVAKQMLEECKPNSKVNSVHMLHEVRAERDRQIEDWMKESTGLRDDYSHLERLREKK